MQGQAVLVSIPTLRNRRKGIITNVNEIDGTLTVLLQSNGLSYQITHDQIKAQKPTVENDILAAPNQTVPNLNDSIVSSISVRRTRRRTINLNNENLKSPIVVSSHSEESAPFMTPIPKRQITKPFSTKKLKKHEETIIHKSIDIRSIIFNLLQLVHFLFFALLTVTILNVCINQQCQISELSLTETVKYFSPFFIIKESTLIWFLCFFTFHSILNYLSHAVSLPKHIINYISPAFIASIFFTLAYYKLYYFFAVFDNIPSLFAAYFYLTIILTMVSITKDGAVLFNSAVQNFFHQHSSLLTFFIFLNHSMLSKSPHTDHQQFYLFCIFCYVIVSLIRIESVENINSPNFVQLLLTSPFLLTIPAFNALSSVNVRWRMAIYVPIFMNFNIPFIWLIENRWSNEPITSKTRLYILFFYSMLKISIALICGFEQTSIAIWLAVLGDCFSFILF